MAGGWGREMFPLEEGVWGNRGSSIVRRQANLWERFRFGGVGRFRFSFQTRIRAWPGGQHQLTYRSDEAERGAAQSMATGVLPDDPG